MALGTVLDYKCPSCGAPISFDSDAQKMKCPYCETESDIAALKELDAVLEQPAEDNIRWQEQVGTQWQEGELEQLADFVCNNCGGQIQCEATTIATHCPYCDSPVVMAPRVAGQLRPDLVVPFQLDKKAATEALRNHLRGKMLLPKRFRDESWIQKIQGIYVPFWLFDADAFGDIHYRATRVHTWSDSRYNYIKTSHYRLHRAGNMGFFGVPVDGSVKMDNALMESIEPYDMTKAVDFQTAYLAGFLADKYDVDADGCVCRANDRIKQSLEWALRGTIYGYDTCAAIRKSFGLTDGRVRYALLPVWLLNTVYKDKTYTFAMNGQTGRFVGNLPISWAAFFGWWIGLTAVIGSVATLIASLL